ncbi:sodium:solute symporter [Niabella ginsenosidivorans]|uniref:Sodium:solute symporter n=1 Tax=Niabella ginsenosidivorans TaxID=1176587 RepID=A0A1A9HYB8_9BACT|nr:sodium/solute symporter [Niabella ginsenosidivorans]ANH79819.1 sodium:solute symporter [Niabella ginsenosidivorans]
MIRSLSTIDLVVVALLLLSFVIASMYSSFRKKNSEEYFMAGRSLKWYSVAGSIFGTNIHAQQIIGMMGVGYSIGFAQSHYEFLAVAAILILVYVFIPVYRKGNFFTLSQFLENRFNRGSRLAYTILMLAFIMIQLIAGFYIGSRTLGILFEGTALEPTYIQGILVIAIVTIVFTVFGGMSSVVIADNILTVIMVLAVLVIGTLTFMQPEIGGFTGLLRLDHAHANKMHLYLPANHPDLPWTGVFTGLVILHFFYWTTNQYQVQRVLAAETERDAKLGSIVAGMLKFLIPFFSIAAGTAAFYLFNSRFGKNVVLPDDTFITLLKTVVPVGFGLSGLILAGLICAIFSAIYSMMNSVSTMLAYDIYRNYINKHASDRRTVRFGQLGIIVMCAIATALAYVTFDPNSSENFFLILANQASYIKPGLVVVFFWGILWRKTHPIAALTVLIASPLIGWGLDILYNHFLANFATVANLFGTHFNFLHRVFMIFFVGSILLVVLSNYFNRTRGVVATNELSVSFSGTGKAIVRAVVIHAPILALVLFRIITPQVAAYPAALLTFGLFLWYMRKEESGYRFYQSDIFYAGILTGALIWILYFFA